MLPDDLQQRFEELEARLERHANRAKHLRDQGLTELAEREDERWKAVSKEYVTVGNQIEDQRPKSSPQPTDYVDYEKFCCGSFRC